MKIFESSAFCFYHEARSPDRLLITYSPAVGPNAGQQFWGQSFCEKTGTSALGLVSNYRSWYPAVQMGGIVERGRKVTPTYTKVACYGGSMGAYGALKWGKAIGASVAIAFSPQISIDPADTAGYDARFADQYKPHLNAGMILRREDLPERSYVFYDPYHPEDTANALAIADLVKDGDGPVVRLIAMPSTGHFAIRIFAGTERALRMLEMCESDDIVGLRRFSSELRRPHAQRMHTLSLRMLPRRVSAALTAHRRVTPGGLPAGQVFREFVSALDDGGYEEQALEVAREMAAKHDGDADVMLYFLRRLRRAGLIDEAMTYEEALTNKQVRSADLAVLLADLAARAKRLERARTWCALARQIASSRPAAATRTFRQLSGVMSNAGYVVDAVELLQSALQVTPGDQQIEAQLLRLLLRDRQFDDAGRIEEARDPATVTDPVLALALAEAAFRLRRSDRAKAWAATARRNADGKLEDEERRRMELRLSKLKLAA